MSETIEKRASQLPNFNVSKVLFHQTHSLKPKDIQFNAKNLILAFEKLEPVIFYIFLLRN